MNANTKKGLIIGGSVLFIALLYYVYKQGKNSNPNEQATLPPDQSPSGGTSSNANLERIATNIYNDCKGVNWFTDHDESIYDEALSLSNTDFTQTWNIWNALYQKKEEETLTKFIQDQTAIIFTPWETAKHAMLARFATLNLS